MKKFYSIIVLLLGIYMFVSFSNGARIYLESDSKDLILNCENNIYIMIDTQGEEIFGASVNMLYDRKNIGILGFYLNEELNLPLDIAKDENMSVFKTSALSLIRDNKHKQKGFSGQFKYGTFVIKNRGNIQNTVFDFMFDGPGVTTDNMDVFRLGDARDVLTIVEGRTFNFVDGVCIHEAPDGQDQLDDSYNFKDDLNKNLENIARVDKIYAYKIFFEDYGVYGLILLLVLILLFIMRKKGIIKNKKLLADKENKNV